MNRYRINKNSILSIEAGAISKMMRYCQKPGMNEGGGILLGKVRNDYSKYIITDISEPCGRDKSGRYYFVRNKDKAQEIINAAWEQSDGEINYLGEWHTHPELNPTPSNVDKRLINQCLKANYYTFDGLFLMILGKEGQLYVGFKTNHMKRIEQLKVLEE